MCPPSKIGTAGGRSPASWEQSYRGRHGETPVEPVRPGTNRAAIEARVDILAHPGFITQEEAELARENNVCLEITSRSGHNITNGHVVRMAKLAGAKMVVDTDSHAPRDLINSKRAS